GPERQTEPPAPEHLVEEAVTGEIERLPTEPRASAGRLEAEREGGHGGGGWRGSRARGGRGQWRERLARCVAKGAVGGPIGAVAAGDVPSASGEAGRGR